MKPVVMVVHPDYDETTRSVARNRWLGLNVRRKGVHLKLISKRYSSVVEASRLYVEIVRKVENAARGPDNHKIACRGSDRTWGLRAGRVGIYLELSAGWHTCGIE